MQKKKQHNVESSTLGQNLRKERTTEMQLLCNNLRKTEKYIREQYCRYQWSNDMLTTK